MNDQSRLSENELTQIREFVVYAKSAGYGFVAFEVIRQTTLQQVFDNLHGNIPEKDWSIIDFKGNSDESPLQVIRQAVEKNPGCRIFFITSLHLSHAATKEDETRILQNINLFRDPLIALKKILIFCLPPYFIDLLMSKAPDFWDFVPLKYEFLDAPPDKGETRSFDGEALNQDYLKNQIRFLENALATYLLSDEERIAKMKELAEAYRNSYQWQKAIEKAKEAIELQEKILAPDHHDLATSNYNLSRIYLVIGNFPQALEFQLKANDIYEKVHSPDHLDLATSYNNLSMIYQAMGNLPQALDFQLKTVGIREKVLETNHPDRAQSYNNLSTIYKDMGNLPQALEFQLKAKKIQEKVQDKDHPLLASCYNNLSLIYRDMGNLPQALEYSLKDIGICEKVLSPDHPDLATSYNNLCSIFYDMKEFEKALFYINKAIEIRKKSLPKEHPSIQNALDWQRLVEEKLSGK